MKKISTGFSASFTPSVCSECPAFKQCPVSKGKKAYYIRYKYKDVRLAQRRRIESTASFKDKYRFRAGVEATMSEFDRRTGVKHLRVRGMKAVYFAAVMKAIGVNIFRASRHRKWQIDLPIPPYGAFLTALAVSCLIKEQFKRRLQEDIAFSIKKPGVCLFYIFWCMKMVESFMYFLNGPKRSFDFSFCPGCSSVTIFAIWHICVRNSMPRYRPSQKL